MTTQQTAKTNQDNVPTLSERAGELKDKAGGLFQSGVDAVKNNPGTTAAIVGGVAAAAAAYVTRDKLAETATGLREKVSKTGKQDDTSAA